MYNRWLYAACAVQACAAESDLFICMRPTMRHVINIGQSSPECLLKSLKVISKFIQNNVQRFQDLVRVWHVSLTCHANHLLKLSPLPSAVASVRIHFTAGSLGPNTWIPWAYAMAGAVVLFVINGWWQHAR